MSRSAIFAITPLDGKCKNLQMPLTSLLHISQPSYLRKLTYIKLLAKRDHQITSVSLFRQSRPSSNSPIALSETLFASLELSFHQSQVFLSTNSYTLLSHTSSIQHIVSFTQSVPLPSQTHLFSLSYYP